MARYNDHVQYDAHIVYNEGVTGSNYAAAGTVAATSALSGAVTSNLVASASTAGVSSLTGAVTANRVASGTVAGVSGVRGKVPPQRPVQLILDVLEFPASLWSAAESARPSWGIQIFGGASIFADAAQTEIFAAAIAQMQGRWEESTSSNRQEGSSA